MLGPRDAWRPADLLARWVLNAGAWFALAVVALAWFVWSGAPLARWTALHLALLGGVSSLVLGAAQLFATAYLMTTPPARRVVLAQLVVWDLGTALVAYGVPHGVRAAVDVGAVLVAACLALFARALRDLARRSIQRMPWATRWYLAAAGCLALGALVGARVSAGAYVPGGSLVGAHVVLNVGGWLGCAIVGTLHTLYPTLTGARLRRPELQPRVFWAWMAGVGLLAQGVAVGWPVLVVGGWACFAAAAVLLAFNLSAGRPAGVPARIVGGAQLLLVAGAGVGLWLAVFEGAPAPVGDPARGPLGWLLLAGWVGGTVVGSLWHLMGMLRASGALRVGR